SRAHRGVLPVMIRRAARMPNASANVSSMWTPRRVNGVEVTPGVYTRAGDGHHVRRPVGAPPRHPMGTPASSPRRQRLRRVAQRADRVVLERDGRMAIEVLAHMRLDGMVVLGFHVQAPPR